MTDGSPLQPPYSPYPPYPTAALTPPPMPMQAPPTHASPTPPQAPPTHGAPPQAAPKTRRPVVALTVAASLLAGATGGAVGGWFARRDSASNAAAATSTGAVTARTTSATLSDSHLDVAAILAKVGPSVVAINTEVTQQRGPYIARGQGAGTGVVLTADGQILTNAHVIDGATSITVSVGGTDRELPAKVVAADTGHDLALLQVTESVTLTPATLGSSSDVVVGDDVVAVGNALALQGGMSVTRGIVSALHRSIEAGSDSGSESLSGLIQTDAAISSGNSGGPLVNSAGQVVGINTAVAGSSGSTTASNIGFAIPIDTAKQVLEQLRR